MYLNHRFAVVICMRLLVLLVMVQVAADYANCLALPPVLLCGIVLCSENVPHVQIFSGRFKDRFAELMFDVDEGVAAAGLRLQALLVHHNVLRQEVGRLGLQALRPLWSSSSVMPLVGASGCAKLPPRWLSGAAVAGVASRAVTAIRPHASDVYAHFLLLLLLLQMPLRCVQDHVVALLQQHLRFTASCRS